MVYYLARKILIIHHSGLIGGAGVSFFNTWIELKKKYNVVSYVPDDPPDLLRFLKEKGLNPNTFPFRLGKLTYYSGGNNLLNFRFWYHAIHSFFQISYWKKVIDNENPDLIIVNSKVLCWMGKLFKRANKPCICFVRETIPGSPDKIMNRIMRNMLEDFTLVSFISNYDLIQTKLNKAKTVVSNDFLEIDNYEDKLGKVNACKQLNILHDEFNVLFVGGIDRLKGIDVAAKAMLFLTNENIKLIVAGKDSGDVTYNLKSFLKIIKKRKSIKFSKEVKQYIKSAGIEEQIKFIGIQTDMSIPFSACDILIFPMKEPHQARPAFEIGVQKKPVIISDFPNIREFINDGVNGLTFEANNSRALSEAILKLKNDKELCSRLGNSNYECTVRQHTRSNAMHNLILEIDRILD